MPTPLRTSRIGSVYYQLLRDHLVDPVTRLGATPNQLSLLSLAAAMMVPIGFAVHPILGLIIMIISALIDSLDGVIARHTGMTSKWGQFLDAISDPISDACYLVGIWLLIWHHPSRLMAFFLLVTALVLMQTISFARVKAEAMSVDCPPEYLDRSMRVLFFLIWGLSTVVIYAGRPMVVWLGMVLYIALCIVTLFLRLQRIRRLLAD